MAIVAIDTKQKRASALGFLFLGAVAIVPDGAIGQADRQQSLSSYSGILVDPPVIVSPDCYVPFIGVINESCGFTGSIDGSANAFIGLINAEPVAGIGILYPTKGFTGIIDSSDTAFQGKLTDSIGFEGDMCDC